MWMYSYKIRILKFFLILSFYIVIINNTFSINVYTSVSYKFNLDVEDGLENLALYMSKTMKCLCHDVWEHRLTMMLIIKWNLNFISLTTMCVPEIIEIGFVCMLKSCDFLDLFWRIYCLRAYINAFIHDDNSYITRSWCIFTAISNNTFGIVLIIRCT